MSWESSDSLLSAEIDAQLDQLLAEWQAHHQLDATRAEAIRQAIVESPAASSDEWWQQYISYLDKALRQANRASRDATNRSLKAMNQRWPWLSFAQQGASDVRDWQPYLKLA